MYFITSISLIPFPNPLTSHLSHNVTSIFCIPSFPSTNTTLLTSPGSLAYIIGTAKFKKIFLCSVFLQFLISLTNSKVYRPAMEAVVVANAGTILPALSLTVSQSIDSNL